MSVYYCARCNESVDGIKHDCPTTQSAETWDDIADRLFRETVTEMAEGATAFEAGRDDMLAEVRELIENRLAQLLGVRADEYRDLLAQLPDTKETQ